MASVFKIRGRNKAPSSTYYGKVKVAPRTWERVKLYSDKTASRRRLNELQRQAEQRDAGVVRIEMDQAGRPLAEHAADYLSALKLAGVAEDHHRIASWMLTRLIELTGWTRIADITADSLRAMLVKLSAEGKATNYLNKFISRGK